MSTTVILPRAKGTDGVTPLFTIGTVTTGIVPTVTQTGTPTNPVLNFVFPVPQAVLPSNSEVSGAVKGNTYGTFETAARFWSIANEPNGRPQVMGITTPSQLATYGDRDSVASYASNLGPPLTQSVAAVSFTATTVVLSAPANSSVLTGMIVDTSDATKFSGIITAISSDRLTLTVSGWFQLGNTAPGQVPTGTPTLYINPTTKVWAHNANVTIIPSSYAGRGAGFELGVLNNKGPMTYGSGGIGVDGGINMLWGYDAVNLGTFQGGVGFIQRGDFLRGFVSRGAAQFGFCVEDNTQNPAYSFGSEATTGKHFSSRPGGVEKMYVRAKDGACISTTELRHASPLNTFYGITEVNGVKITGSTAGVETSIFSIGSDATVNLAIGAKGSTGIVAVGALSGVGNESFRVQQIANQVNGVEVRGAISGGSPRIKPFGSGNVSLLAHALGTGTVQIGDASNAVGFFNSGGQTKQTVTGSRGGNAALASLLTALAAYGIITDGTTA